VHSHTYHQDVLRALYASPAYRVDGLRTLATKVAGVQPSPNAEIEVDRDVAVAAELLALRGLITIDRAPARAAFSLTSLGRAYMRPQAKPAATTLSSAVALTTALSGCTTILAPASTSTSTAPSLDELRQRAPSRIEQVVDPYQGHTYFARCTDCATPTPKTLATTPSVTAPSDITQFIAPDVLARARAAEGSTSVPAQRKQMSQSADDFPTFVERRYVVYFKFADGGVDPAAQLALQRIASQLTGAKSILIVGSTDATGTVASNQRLAERRAKSVSAALAKVGVAGSSIETRAQPNRSSGPPRDAVLLGRAAPPTPAALARHAEIVALVSAEAARVASLSK
jgi:outer membrane protein OmpA-like peptidoglycan-associated protein